MIKWYPFLQALVYHTKVRVTIMGHASDFLYASLNTAEVNFILFYRKVKHYEKVSFLKMWAAKPRTKITGIKGISYFHEQAKPLKGI